MWLWLMLRRAGLENSLALAPAGPGMRGSSPRSFPAAETNVSGLAVDQPL